MLAELLIIEPKLIHKVCSHLLDLIVGEGLGRSKGAFYGDIIMDRRLYWRWYGYFFIITSGVKCHFFFSWWCEVSFFFHGGVYSTCWRDRSLGKGLSMSSSSLDECMLWVLTCRTQCRGLVNFLQCPTVRHRCTVALPDTSEHRVFILITDKCLKESWKHREYIKY